MNNMVFRIATNWKHRKTNTSARRCAPPLLVLRFPHFVRDFGKYVVLNISAGLLRISVDV
jgi:hypothetical protein